MAVFTPDEKILSRRIKECLKTKESRQHLRKYLEQHNRIPKLQVLDLYEEVCNRTNWDDKRITELIAEVDGIQYPGNATDKHEAVMEQCCKELEDVKLGFIAYLKKHKIINDPSH